MSYLLKLFHDTLETESEVIPGVETQHSIIYVFKGRVDINSQAVEEGTAVYVGDFATVKTGKTATTLWRWELVPENDPIHLLKGKGVKTVLKLSRKIKMFELVPTSRWLFRLDGIINHEGATGFHSHLGSGIRCLVEGQIRVFSNKGECSDNTKPGDTWYEEGAYPVASTSDPGNKATFLRVMILPPEYEDNPNTLVIIGKNSTAKSQRKDYVQKIITLR